MKKKPTIWQSLARMKNVDNIFDLVITTAYFDGKFGNNIQVDESRKIFERIKKLIKE